MAKFIRGTATPQAGKGKTEQKKKEYKGYKMTEKILSASKIGNRLDVTLWTVWFLSLLKLQRRKTERGNENVSK